MPESANVGCESQHRRQWLAVGAAVLMLGGTFTAFSASAGPAPIKIAVFDFELDDFSGGAGIAGDKAADAEQLNRATSEARQLIGGSGRYTLVDISADAAVGSDSLRRQCSGCEAAIALKHGADQYLVGVVTRISRTEYVVHIQIRDARTDKELLTRQSGLRMGANYSWDRGAASVIKSGVLDSP